LHSYKRAHGLRVIRAQQPRARRVGICTVVPFEDAMSREQAQRPVERLCIRASVLALSGVSSNASAIPSSAITCNVRGGVKPIETCISASIGDSAMFTLHRERPVSSTPRAHLVSRINRRLELTGLRTLSPGWVADARPAYDGPSNRAQCTRSYFCNERM